MDFKIEEEAGGRGSLPFSPVAAENRSFLTDSDDLSGLVAGKEEEVKKEEREISDKTQVDRERNELNFPSFPSSRAQESKQDDREDLNVAQGWLDDLDDLGPDLAPNHIDKDPALAHEIDDFFNQPEPSEDQGSYGDTSSNADSSVRLSIERGGVTVDRESLGYKPSIEVRREDPRMSDRSPGNPVSLREVPGKEGYSYTEEQKGPLSLREPAKPRGYQLPSESLPAKPVKEEGYKVPLPVARTSPESVSLSQATLHPSFRPSEDIKPPSKSIEIPAKATIPSLKLSDIGSISSPKPLPSNPSPVPKLRPDIRLPVSLRKPESESIDMSTEPVSGKPLRPLEILPTENVYLTSPPSDTPAPKPEKMTGLIEKEMEIESSLKGKKTEIEEGSKKKERKMQVGFLGNLVEESGEPIRQRPKPSESSFPLEKEKMPVEEVKKPVIPPLASAFATGKSLQGKEGNKVKFDTGEEKLPPLQISMMEEVEESGDYDPIPAQPQKAQPVSPIKLKPPPSNNPVPPATDSTKPALSPRVQVIDMHRPREYDDEADRRRNEPPVLSYHQVYDEIISSDINQYTAEAQPEKRSCMKAFLACCSNTQEILVPEVKASMSILMAFERRMMNASNPIDQSLLMSIWTRCMDLEPFSLQHPAWKSTLGFTTPQPLSQDLIGTLGPLQLLFCLSEGRPEVVKQTFTEARKPGSGFSLATMSIEITRVALKVVKSGVMNGDFERFHNVKDVFNCLYLGSFLMWMEKNATIPGKIDLVTFEKMIRKTPLEVVKLGRRSIIS